MVTKVYCATIHGIEACIVAVESDVGDGLPSFDMVGLLAAEVKEAKERVRTALKNSGFLIPPKRITINLAPANIRKSGTFFDLPIAVSILCGLNIIPVNKTENSLFVGELGLDGSIVGVNGVYPIVLAAKEQGYERCFIPKANATEVELIDGIEIIALTSLQEVVFALMSDDVEKYLIGNKSENQECDNKAHNYQYDFSDIKGQLAARRAAEITAAGMHNMLMIGPPGAGKSMIAKCMPSIMPSMNYTEQSQVAKIYSVAGLDVSKATILRPYRSPHHSVSMSAFVGGGSNPVPGEMTLAHNGCLFLDELPEFSRQIIESLRQPLEERVVNLSRVSGKYVFPADFILLGATNPCKCGYYPDRSRCKCTEYDVKKYMDKISGPIMDRIDLCVGIEPVSYEELNSDVKSEASAEIRKRVEQAFAIQQDRYKDIDINFNGQLDGRYIREYCPIGNKEQQVMEQAFRKMNLSVRSYNKIIKVARTIADLEGAKKIEVRHLAEAMSYRLSS